MLGYLKAIFTTLGNFFIGLKDLLLNILGNVYNFIESLVLFIPRLIYSLLSDLAFFIFDTCQTCGVLYIHNTIKSAIDSFRSVQSAPIDSSGGFTFNFSGCISYFADALGLNAGFQLLICAYILRFIIRRLPVVG
jgi:hypothetical protein